MLVNRWTWNFGWGSPERPEEDKSQGQKGERRRWMRRKRGVCVHVGVCVSRKVRVHGAARGVNRPQTGATVNLRWATCLLQQPVTSPWPHWELYNWLRYCNVLTQLIPGITFFTKAQDEPHLSETHIIADEELQLRKSFMIPVCFQTHLHSGSICTHARQRSPIRNRCRVWSRRSTCAVDSTCFCFFGVFFPDDLMRWIEADGRDCLRVPHDLCVFRCYRHCWCVLFIRYRVDFNLCDTTPNPSVLSVCSLLNYLKLDLEAGTRPVLAHLVHEWSALNFDLKASTHNNSYV